MGGKSSSSSSSSSAQTTKTNTVDGLNTGQQIIGDNLTVNNAFGAEVKEAFSEVLALVNKTLDIATDAGGAAIDAVSQRYEAQENPNLALTSRFIPVLAIVAVGASLYFLTKGLK